MRAALNLTFDGGKARLRRCALDISPSAAGFVTTLWGMVLAAGSSGAESLAALEALCRACWPPIYAYIRRLGHGAEESRDLTREFFAHLLARPFARGGAS